MDEESFKQARRVLIENPCAFERALLTRKCNCSQAVKKNIAERETISCSSGTDAKQCDEFLSRVKQQANFILKTPKTPSGLSFATAMKIQFGSLLGLVENLEKDDMENEKIDNICMLLSQVANKYGGIVNIPMRSIVYHIHIYRLRQHTKKRLNYPSVVDERMQSRE